jgi:hypothetical protein
VFCYKKSRFMAGRRLIIYSVAAVISLSAAHISMAADDGWSLDRDFSNGRWRTEITTTTGAIDSDWPQHEKDYFFLGSIEYEWPIHSYTTCSLRGTPVFLFNRHRGDGYDTTHIYGAGFGLAFRLYERKEMTGLFAEIGSSALWHTEHLPNNDSKLNFISDVGIGYGFKNNISVSAKYFHISNAGLKDLNSGLDALGISLAYVF